MLLWLIRYKRKGIRMGQKNLECRDVQRLRHLPCTRLTLFTSAALHMPPEQFQEWSLSTIRCAPPKNKSFGRKIMKEAEGGNPHQDQGWRVQHIVSAGKLRTPCLACWPGAAHSREAAVGEGVPVWPLHFGRSDFSKWGEAIVRMS